MRFGLIVVALLALCHTCTSFRAISFMRPKLLVSSLSRATCTTTRPRGHVLFMSISDTTNQRTVLKEELVKKIAEFKRLQKLHGSEPIDFGVRGGALDATTRRPRNLAEGYAAISKDVDSAAQAIFRTIQRLETLNPTPNATKYLGCGHQAESLLCPLNGEWRQMFTTAADATFTPNKHRGEAQMMNIVNAKDGIITNVITFQRRPDGKRPTLEQFRVEISVCALSPTRVKLNFQSARAVFTRLFGIPLFGRTLTVYFPLVPAVAVTKVINMMRRKREEDTYFDVLYLDDELRIHKTDGGNYFVQARSESRIWEYGTHA